MTEKWPKTLIKSSKTLDLIWFDLIWFDLIGFDWIWLDLIGFDLIDLIKTSLTGMKSPGGAFHVGPQT